MFANNVKVDKFSVYRYTADTADMNDPDEVSPSLNEFMVLSDGRNAGGTANNPLYYQFGHLNNADRIIVKDTVVGRAYSKPTETQGTAGEQGAILQGDDRFALGT